MHDLPSMKVLQSFSYLISDELEMGLFHYIVANCVMEIGFHELECQIYVFVIFGWNYIEKFDYVGVIRLLQNFDFSEGSLGIGRMLKCVKYLFECKYFIGAFLPNFPDMAIGS